LSESYADTADTVQHLTFVADAISDSAAANEPAAVTSGTQYILFYIALLLLLSLLLQDCPP